MAWIAIRSFYQEILLSIGMVLLGFFLILITMDGLNEAKHIGKFEYDWIVLIKVVLLRTPDYTYRLLPICALIGGVLALSSMAARSELVAWRASGLSVKHMLWILLSMGVLLAVGVAAIGEAGISSAEREARRIKNQALHIESYFKDNGGFWGRQNLSNHGTRMINARTLINGDVLSDVRVYDLSPDFALQQVVFAKTAQEKTTDGARGQWQLNDVRAVRAQLSPTGVVVAQNEQHLPVLNMDWGDTDLDVVRQHDLNLVTMSVAQLQNRVQTLRNNGQRAREYELALWQKLMYPVGIVVMMLLALPFAFMNTRKGGVGVRVMTGIFIGLLFFLLSAVVQFLGPQVAWSPIGLALLPVVLFFVVAMVWLWRVTRVRV